MIVSNRVGPFYGRTLACLVGLLLCSCQAVVAQMAQGASAPSGVIETAPLRLGPGDLLTVQVFATPDLSGPVRVDEAGYINPPLGGRLSVAGLTPDQASSVIENQLKSNQVMLDPHVTIMVTQYATGGVTVLGEVNRPGTFTLLGPHSLYDALSAAGGTTLNQGSRITISRQRDPGHPAVVDVSSPDYSSRQRLTSILPGDTVVVSRAELIYVVGDVVRPGPVPMVSGVPLSVLNVLGIAQGLNRTALSKHASVIRQEADKVVTITLNLDKIMRSEEANIVLLPADILVVPRSGKKVFLEYALPATTGAVTSAVTSALIVR